MECYAECSALSSTAPWVRRYGVSDRRAERDAAQEGFLRSEGRTTSFVSHHRQLTGEIGFVQLKSNPCVYVYISEQSRHSTVNITDGHKYVAAILALYADDVVLIGRDDAVLSMVKTKLSARFNMKDLGDACLILGIEFSRDLNRGTVSG